MTPPNPQPTLPAEGAYTETERLFIAEEPPSTFPGNQHSNWGLVRRVLTDEMQLAVDNLNALFNELFIETASGYLSDWEKELGLPISTSLSDATRRSTLSSRRTRVAFTRTRVKSLIERYLTDTFGTSAEFGVGGIPMSAGGVPLFAEGGAVPTLYRVYEDVRGYAYTVRIKSTVTPSAALVRELTWMTPAHLTFTYDNSLLNILNYGFEIRNSQPLGYYRLASLADASGNANNGTAVGGVVAGGAAALITAPDADGATTFDGVDDGITVLDPAGNWPFSSMSPISFSMEAWIKPSALPTLGNYKTAMSKGNAILGLFSTPGSFAFNTGGGGADLLSPSGAAVNGVYHVVGSFDGSTAKLYVNGALVASGARAAPSSLTGLLAIGRLSAAGSMFFSGVIDEPAFYDRCLSQAEITRHYNTGINVA